LDVNYCNYGLLVSFLPRDATQSTVMPQYVESTVHPSVCP